VEQTKPTTELTTSTLIKRLIVMLIISGAVGLFGGTIGLDSHQQIASAVFLAIILGTLFFWTFRLAIAFLGISVLILTKSLDIPQFVESAALPVILFLVGMMIIVGALRDLGLFTWTVQLIASIPKMSGRKFIITVAVASALLSCTVNEVTSIIFISTLVFHICNRLKLNPTPYLIICVLCTNVGSAGTMLGNPVGIYIGTRAGLTFPDFIYWAFPIMIVSLITTVVLTAFYYRRELNEFNLKLQERVRRNLSLVPKIEVPYKRGLAILIVTIVFIASHHYIEGLFDLDKNSILLVAPLACAGVIMIIRRDRARYYVEHEVDWWTLVFFMLLFAIAGALEHTEVTVFMAKKFHHGFGDNIFVLVPAIMGVTAIGSAFVDNVIFVAAFCPVIEELGKSVHAMPLWWALLFGACFGGNITMIGSTANIVALGMLEKHYHFHITFLQWFKIGLLSACVACLVAYILLIITIPFMPAH